MNLFFYGIFATLRFQQNSEKMCKTFKRGIMKLIFMGQQDSSFPNCFVTSSIVYNF